MAGLGRRKCLHCREWFVPDKYNERHQRYCSMLECRRASKAASQRRWLARNRDYFRGPVHCTRVRNWRACHPYYWRRCRRRPSSALQDLAFSQHLAAAALASHLRGGPPQELIGTRLEELYINGQKLLPVWAASEDRLQPESRHG